MNDGCMEGELLINEAFMAILEHTADKFYCLTCFDGFLRTIDLFSAGCYTENQKIPDKTEVLLWQ